MGRKSPKKESAIKTDIWLDQAGKNWSKGFTPKDGTPEKARFDRAVEGDLRKDYSRIVNEKDPNTFTKMKKSMDQVTPGNWKSKDKIDGKMP